MSALVVNELTKDYGAVRAVAALSLRVEPGTIVGLLGPNGAGKTTAISMIAGVVEPSGGTASVCGHDVRRDAFAARALLGVVPQDLALYPELTARQNLRFFGAMWRLRRRELDDRVAAALEVAGLAHRADHRVDTFSGGMKRRLNLVAALLHQPRVLVLDEPTVGVDPQSRAHIFDAVRRLRDDGSAVLYTSHYMEEVEALCDRVAIMDRGAIVAEDTVVGLIAAHADAALSVRVDGDAAAAAAALAPMGEVTAGGDTLRIATAASVGDIVRAVEATGATVVEVHRLSAGLEAVFLSLTGHALRDD